MCCTGLAPCQAQHTLLGNKFAFGFGFGVLILGALGFSMLGFRALSFTALSFSKRRAHVGCKPKLHVLKHANATCAKAKYAKV